MSTTLDRLATPLKTGGPLLSQGPFLVATDGSARADGSLRAATLLARRTGAAVDVLSVLTPMPVVAPEIALPVTPELEVARHRELVQQVRAQLGRVCGDTEQWRLTIADGEPPTAIARTARATEVKLVVVGLGRHGIIDRLFGDETALQLLRISPVPVLAVPSTFVALPHRAIAAMDFSVSSIRAAHAALELLGESGILYLVHVIARDVESGMWEALHQDYMKAVNEGFERVKQQLGAPPAIQIETVTLRGDPAHELLQYAGTANVELIACGSHGHGFFSRLLLGSVASKLLRGASCAVLGVPQPATAGVGDDGLRRGERASHRIPPSAWASELEAFTRRNGGRRASLEVDDPLVGAQAQEHDYPLLGIAYDHNDRRVEIMLGDLGGGEHLTRNIGGVSAIDLLRDGEDHDLALRIEHGTGQTLLTLTR